MTEPAIIVIIGVVLSAIGAILGGFGAYRASTKQDREKAQFERELRQRSDAQAESQRRLAEKSEEIALLNRQIAGSQTDLRKRSDEIAELNKSIANTQQGLRVKSEEIAKLNQEIADAQRDLRKKSEEIAEINKQTADSVIGGDSFCYLGFIPLEGNNGVQVVVDHLGKYPLYDVWIEIQDLEANLKAFEKGGLDLTVPFDQRVISKFIGNLSSNQGLLLGNLPLTDRQKLRYLVVFRARNGTWSQNFCKRVINGTHLSASRVTKSSGGKTVVLYESIDPGFPRSSGEIMW